MQSLKMYAKMVYAVKMTTYSYILHCFVCTFYDHQHTTQEEKCKTQTLGEAETGTKFL